MTDYMVSPFARPLTPILTYQAAGDLRCKCGNEDPDKFLTVTDLAGSTLKGFVCAACENAAVHAAKQLTVEADFKKFYVGEFPPLIEDVYQAHTLLAEKLHTSPDRPLTGCTSYISRRMQCGYNHAAEIMQLMEQKGGITPANHKGARELRPLPRS